MKPVPQEDLCLVTVNPVKNPVAGEVTGPSVEASVVALLHEHDELASLPSKELCLCPTFSAVVSFDQKSFCLQPECLLQDSDWSK